MDEHDETESRPSADDSREGGSSSLAGLAEGTTPDTAAYEPTHDDTSADDDAPTPDSTAGTTLSDLANSVRKRRPTDDESEQTTDSTPTDWDFLESDDEVEAGSAEAVEFDADAVAVLDQLREETNTLLVGPAGCTADHRLCAQLMTSQSAVVGLRQLVISIDTPPQEQRDILRTIRSDAVESQALIDAQSYSVSDDVAEYDDVEVMAVASPGDLRRIGILTTKALTRWSDADVPIAVCVHSLSNLLDAVGDSQRVFRFLHILHGRIRAAGARAHFHLDPTRHDEQTVRTFYSLFDAVATFDADGSVTLD